MAKILTGTEYFEAQIDTCISGWLVQKPLGWQNIRGCNCLEPEKESFWYKLES